MYKPKEYEYQPKNIIVCMDGTGNQIEENISNVLKLYRTLKENTTGTNRQVIYYNQGVGTIGQKNTWGQLSQKIANIEGLAFGTGLDNNILQAYKFISRHYHEQKTNRKDKNNKYIYMKDRIYIFGYSRGAHSARVLAAFLYHMGLVKPPQIHLAGAAFSVYKRIKKYDDDDTKDKKMAARKEAIHFNKITRPFKPEIQFLGVWDTVSSMIVPRSDWGYLPGLEKLPSTSQNPIIKTVRHAISIDERRRMFRLEKWVDQQKFKPIFHSPEDQGKQDVQQVWFAGSHGDVGGGHKRKDSGLSQYPLRWMIKEAMQEGLHVNTRMVDYVTLGGLYKKGDTYKYAKPDPDAKKHHSYFTPWILLEILPKFAGLRECKKFRLGIPKIFYIPWWEPRAIPEEAFIHESVILRKKNPKAKYNPVNFPKKYTKVNYDNREAKHWSP